MVNMNSQEKEIYEKPVLLMNNNITGVIPAGLAGAIAAFTAGVAAGVAVKKMVNGRMDFTKMNTLVEVGASV